MLSGLTSSPEPEFHPHPTFPGVEISDLGITNIPLKVSLVMRAIRAYPISYRLVRILENKGIPKHAHPNHGEFYFDGEICAVATLWNRDQEAKEVNLGNQKGGALLLPGGSHMVTSSQATSFFSVKFEIH